MVKTEAIRNMEKQIIELKNKLDQTEQREKLLKQQLITEKRKATEAIGKQIISEGSLTTLKLEMRKLEKEMENEKVQHEQTKIKLEETTEKLEQRENELNTSMNEIIRLQKIIETQNLEIEQYVMRCVLAQEKEL